MKSSAVFPTLSATVFCLCASAQVSPHLQIVSFSVGPDQTLTYPNAPSGANMLGGLADEHTTIMPPATTGGPYLVFAAGVTSTTATGVWGAFALETTDLKTFTFASSLGYPAPSPLMSAGRTFSKCDTTGNTGFDENYAAPGSVLQDPTLPAGNLIMLYEAENHCPGGVFQQPFYATVGFMRSSDNGKTWPDVQPGPLGGSTRFPVVQSPDPQPTSAHGYLGNAIPSGFIDRTATGDYYLYVTYDYFSTSGQAIRVARAKLGTNPLTFQKWYNGSFSQPGIGGLDSDVFPAGACSGQQTSSEINYNDDVGLYILIFRCNSGPSDARVGGWYYSTATSLDQQNWTAPQLIANSVYPLTSPCPGSTTGNDFDGFYPSMMSPGAAAGHTKLTGTIFFTHVACDLNSRQFLSRTFTITALPVSPIPSGGIVNNASYTAGTTPLAPGSIAAIFGTSLTDGTSCLPPKCFPSFDGNGKLNTTMANSQVLINGVAAPLFYASPGQTGVQIPFETTGTSATVAVTIAGQATAPVTLPIGTVSPGIFTVTADGKGAGAITHADGSAVSAASPAKRGEVVIVYGTGLGAVSPAVATGALPAGVSTSTTSVTVTFGTITVTPDYAGLAGCCVGLNQINVKVPAGATVGNSIPLVLNTGGKTSNSVTIAVQ